MRLWSIFALWLAIAPIGQCYLSAEEWARYRPTNEQEIEMYFRHSYALTGIWHLESLSFDRDEDGLPSVVSASFVFSGETIHSQLAIIEDMRTKHTLSFKQTP